MRALSDKWNARLWARDWLNKPSKAELAGRRTAEAAAAQMFAAITEEAASSVAGNRAVASALTSSASRA